MTQSPNPTGARLLHRAEAHLQARRLHPALTAFAQAEAANADPNRCAAGRWQAHMLLGEFEAAWRQSDALRQRGAPDPHRFWQGEDLAGKRVILRCLHGLGDAVQFLRYAPALRARGQSLIVEVPPRFLELAARFDGVDHVITWGEQAPASPPSWDVQIEINELPYLFRTQPEDLPIATNYLKLPRTCPLAPHDPAALRVGAVWASGSWNPARSLPFDLFRPLLATPGCEFWNLQGGSARAAWQSLPPTPALHAAESCAASLSSLAAHIAQLDLLLTPDTLAVHLAGALGTPAWLLLEYAADWRWQHGRDDSPWYPSVRIFRQPRPGDWPALLDRIQQAMGSLTK